MDERQGLKRVFDKATAPVSIERYSLEVLVDIALGDDVDAGAACSALKEANKALGNYTSRIK